MILVPLPTAAADHQTRNAMVIERAGAGTHLPQRELTTECLDATVRGLLGNAAALQQMSDAARARGRPHAAMDIAERINALLRHG
jgi:UDP-N-acetylglucosamine--N-acetylmuramyl-(pentapeptide) pyrophosphoryl-undecaprenol N-acetylglucosamine transferase